MSEENVRVVQAVIDGWLQGDPSTLDLIAEDVIYVSPPTVPNARTYHGHEGVLQWVVDWRQEWTDYELEIERVEDFGDRVITVERHKAKGKRSGIDVDTRSCSLWNFRDGKVIRWQGFPSEEAALEAAGLSV